MDLRSLIFRELGEGLTETELASSVGVPVRTITSILAGKHPKDPAIWGKFARYFWMDADFLRTSDFAHPETLVELSEDDQHSSTIEIRRVPLLTWSQIGQMAINKELSRVIHAKVMLEATDVPGRHTFALKVKDDSMHPLFSEGEIIFVNPDLKYKPGHYVVVERQDGRHKGAQLRQLKEIGGQCILHPLNRRCEDVPLGKHQRILGRVVRLRKNL